MLIHAKDLLTIEPELSKIRESFIESVKAGVSHISAKSITDRNRPALEGIFKPLKPEYIKVVVEKRKSMGIANEVNAGEVYTKLEKLAEEFVAIAKKSTKFKANGFGDIVLYVRGK